MVCWWQIEKLHGKWCEIIDKDNDCGLILFLQTKLHTLLVPAATSTPGD